MDSLLRQIQSLPPEAQKLVSELVRLLSEQYALKKSIRRPKKQKLELGKFVGMWKDREEMADSVAYVRELRKRQWSRDRHQ